MAVLLLLAFFNIYINVKPQCDELPDAILSEIKLVTCRAVAGQYAAELTYIVGGDMEGKTDTQRILEGINGIFPVYGFLNNSISYETQVESTLSYKEVVAMEASDEGVAQESTAKTDVSDTSLALGGCESAAVTVQNGNNSMNTTEFTLSTSAKTQIPLEKLNDFDYLIHNFYVVDRTTTITGSQLNAAELLKKSMKLTTPADEPQILIYHTHSQEGFSDSVPGDPSMSVVGVGEYLAKLLRERYGLNVLHHTGEYDVESRDNAYAKAGPAVEQLLADNPSIEVVIDLHRDGVAETTHLVTEVNGKTMASVMFFNGLSRTTATGDISYLYNPYIQDNLAFSLQLQLMAEQYYPGLVRPIYLKGYRYNMHYCPKSLLVEVGAQTNTLEEAMNAMDPLADVLYRVLCE